jgi:hypothetical protein
MSAGASLTKAKSPDSMTSSSLAAQNARELNSLALRGLVSMFDPERKLFCYRIRRTDRGLVREGLSHRYTVMALLGLNALEHAHGRTRLNVDGIFDSCVRDTHWIRGVGDLGLLIWLTAERSPDRLQELFRRVDLESCLGRFQDAREARTMELAWFLAGLCHAAMASPDCPWPLDDLAVETYHLIEYNRGESGLFGHLARNSSWSGWIRGRIGNFADQIYPIYALSKFAGAFKLDEPLEAAVECARAVCSRQGPLGQWWWLYDSVTGRVLSRYPVFSIDQHGMAPLALFAVEDASHHSFQEFVSRGLNWIYGSNELGQDLRSSSHGLIWRGILPTRKRRKYWDTALNYIRPPKEQTPADLQIFYESRPHELGLLLYSFARFGTA